MNKNNTYFLLILLLLFFITSCHTHTNDFIFYDLSLPSSELVPDEAILQFDNKTITDINIVDSLLFCIQYGSDTFICVINTCQKQVIGSFGTRGQGPEDLIFPQFASSVNGINGLCIYDVNARKIMKIKQKNDKYFLFEKLMDYPIKIFPADNICYSGNLIVGRKIGAGSEKMFFIYDIAKDMIYETDIYPILEANVDDISYAYASNLALNTNRGKIIAGMYFFDMFHIYDLEGKRIKTVCFSKNSIPKVDQERNMLDLKNGYSGIVSVFSTEDYCYFLRYTQIPNINDTEKILIQINWDGEIINTYAINEALVTPKFCIDTQKNKMYAITHSIGADMVEYNNVVSYNLNRE